jgi:hypothetical protein
MISPATIARPSSPSSTVADARIQPAPSPFQPAHLRPRSLSRETALERDDGPPNPLWIVAIGMAVFFGLAAFMMLVL